MLARQYKEHEAFFGPWAGKDVRGWTPELRECEVGILNECRRFEREAITEIEKALASLEG